MKNKNYWFQSALFYICLILVSTLFCCNQDDINPNGSDFWKFEVTINGQTQKAEGNGFGGDNNCWVSDGGTEWVIYMNITDPTSPTFLEGYNGQVTLGGFIPSLGINYIPIISDWLNDAFSETGLIVNTIGGYSLTNGGQVEPNSQGNWLSLPINITDLGTSGLSSLKGECSVTIYCTENFGPPYQYNIPIEINIQFEALRP